MTSRDPDRRTTWITAAGIVAVVLGGAFAVGANLGILTASSDDRVGALAAAGDLVPTSTGEGIADPSAPTTSEASRTFVVATAGSVIVADTDPLAVRSVSVNPGWTWNATPSGAGRLAITFSDSVRTLVFSATRTPDGRISAAVDEIAARQATTADTASSRAARHDDDEEHHEHEGRDDDD